MFINPKDCVIINIVWLTAMFLLTQIFPSPQGKLSQIKKMAFKKTEAIYFNGTGIKLHHISIINIFQVKNKVL